MTPHIDNPYAPTMDVNERTKHRPSRGSHAFAAVATVGALAYITFTVILFFSGPGDLIAGLMFLVNTPVFIGLAVSAFRSTRVSVYFAIGAAVVQMAITIAMLVMQYGDSLTVTGINSAIILPCLAIAMWAWWSNRRYLTAPQALSL